jgi:hypothetical protein
MMAYQVLYVVCGHTKFFVLSFCHGDFIFRVPEMFIFEKSGDVMILYVRKFFEIEVAFLFL